MKQNPHPLALFAFLMAASDIVHLLVFSAPALQLERLAGFMWWLDFLVALSVVVAPTALKRFVALLILDVVGTWSMMPEIPNHLLFLMLVDITILTALGHSLFTSRQRANASLNNQDTKLFDSFAGVVRLQVVLLYLISALHKLNWGFFDIEQSCATAGLRTLGGSLPLDSSWMAHAAVWGTLAFEFGIPIFLCMARTRVLGLLMGVLFHGSFFFAGFPGIISFSVLALSFYVLFLPEEILKMSCAFFRRHHRNLKLLRDAGVSMGLVWLAFTLFTSGDEQAGQLLYLGPLSNSDYLTRIVAAWGIAVAGFIIWGAVSSFRAIPSDNTFLGLQRARITWLGPILILCAGLSPYLGLRAVPAFSMFSNLRTDPGNWNHVFIPEAVRLYTFEGDRVLVSDTNSRRWQSHVGREWPRVELVRRALSSQEPVYFSFDDHGTPKAIRYNGEVATIHGAPVTQPYWMRKWVRFRTLPPTGSAPECVW